MSARYLSTAAALGVIWYGVLQIPSTTRGFMVSLGQVTSVLLLCLVSVLVGVGLRRFIADEGNDRWLAAVGPYAGAVVFGLAAAVAIWVRNGFWALNYVDLFVLLPVWSLLTAVWCSLLVLPMGYLAQRAIRWAAEKED